MKKTLIALLTVFTVLAADSAWAQNIRRHANAIPNQYIVVLASTDDPEAVGLETQSLYAGRLGHVYRRALKGFAIRLTPAAAAALARDPRVNYVEEDGIVQATNLQTSPPWGLDRIDQRNLPLDSVYFYPAFATQVYVHVIDTGVRTTHVDFGGRAFNAGDTVDDDNNPNTPVGNDDGNPNTADGADCNGHGTHVAGTIAGATYGVAKNAIILSHRALNCAGQGTGSSVIAAIDAATGDTRRPAVANMSLGGGASSALDDAVRRGIAAGITFVVSAGNSNVDVSTQSPARVAEAITVGATESNDVRASFSNFGPLVDVFAPGVGIVSAGISSDTAIAEMSGTSMASPHVAGVAALYMEQVGTKTPAVVQAAIVAAATPGLVGSRGSGSPNLLLYSVVGFTIPPPPGPEPGGETLFTTQVPAAQNTGGGNFELGLRVFSDVAGQITALRFWKVAGETGTHVGRLWSATGQLLASVPFTGETASGWQQQSLATAYPVTANTLYVVSVNTASNLFPATTNVFTTELVNGHLHAPAGNNGLYGTPGLFPTTAYANTNYFRDIVFVASGGPPDTTPPTATLTAPLANTTVSASVNVTADASDNVGVMGVQFAVDGSPLGAEDTTAPYGVPWDTTLTANGPHTVSATARDAAGNQVVKSVMVTVSNAGGSPAQTLLTTQVPAQQNTGGGNFELGLQVFSDVAGQITALRFWKVAGETGTHVGRLWSATGQLLASVPFTGETASGWQQQSLAAAYPVTANTLYVVSVNTASNLFPATTNVFTTELVNGHLHAPAGNNGLYGTPGLFPTTAYANTNYFRDIVFVASGGPPDTTPPTATLTAPLANTTVSASVNVTADASDNVGVMGVQFAVDGSPLGAEDTTAPYGVPWDTTLTANGPHTVSATARDAAGNQVVKSVMVTVSNAGGSPAQTLLTTQVPAQQNTGGGNFELGLQVFSDVAGQITALRFWKVAGETGTHVGRLWSATGQLLASVPFTGETASGWQQQSLAAAYPVTANTLYVVSVNTASNLFPATTNVFTTELVNGHLHAPAGNNGLYGPPGFLPTTPYASTNYFRDIVFVAGP